MYFIRIIRFMKFYILKENTIRQKLYFNFANFYFKFRKLFIGREVNFNKFKSEGKSFFNSPPATIVLQKIGNGGLFAIIRQILIGCEVAKQQGSKIFIDLAQNPIEFSSIKSWRGTKNPWEYFFNQPDNLTDEYIYESKNFQIQNISNLGANHFLYGKNFEFIFDEQKLSLLNGLLFKFIKLNEFTKNYVETVSRLINFVPDETLGIFVRGIPHPLNNPGHAKPVNPKIVLDEILQTLEENSSIKSILVSSHTLNFRNTLSRRLGSKYTIYEDFRFKNSSDISRHVSQRFNLSGRRQLNQLDYLAEVYLLGKSKYLIAEISNASAIAAGFGGSNQFRKFISSGFY